MWLKFFKRLGIALVPFGFLIVLAGFFYNATTTHIQCLPENSPQCVSITRTLDQVILPEKTPAASPAPDNAETKQPEQPANPEELKKKQEELKKQEEAKKQEEYKKQEITALRYSGRAVFVFLSNLYFLVCLIAACICLYIVYKCLKESVFFPLKKDAFYARIGVAAVGGITLAATFCLYNHPEIFMPVFEFLLKNKIETELPAAREMLKVVNSFGFSVCLMLCLTICVILYAPVKPTNPEGLVQGSQKMRYLRTVLYLGTMILVIGMLLIRSVQQWSLAFMLRSEQTIKTAENFFSNLLAVEGGFFTLVLAAAYLPAAFIVRWQVEQIQGLPEAEAEKEKSLQNYHLTFSFNEALPKIIAILGPILAGPVGDLFTKLIK